MKLFKEIEDNNAYRLMVVLGREKMDSEDVEEAKKLIDQVDVADLWKACTEHEMEAVIYPNFLTLMPDKVPTYWTEAYKKAKVQLDFMMMHLERVAQGLAKHDIPIIALKNGGIAAGLIDDVAKCPMGDIDTLVRQADFHKAHEVLLQLGFEFKFRSEFEFEDLSEAYIDGGTEYHIKDKESGLEMWFEMSWRPVAGRWIRLDKEPKADVLISESVSIENSKVRLLSPEDNLLQVAIHTAKHSYVREPGFRLHLDVDRVVKYSEINWKKFLAKTKQVGARNAIYFSLYIAKKLFKTPIPESVIKALRPSALRRRYIFSTLANVRLLHPVEEKFSKVQFVLFQVMLYDRVVDIFRVIVPSVDWLREKYDFKSAFLVPIYVGYRMLDLVGIRKSKLDK